MTMLDVFKGLKLDEPAFITEEDLDSMIQDFTSLPVGPVGPVGPVDPTDPVDEVVHVLVGKAPVDDDVFKDPNWDNE